VVDSDEESQPDDDEISNAEVEVADLIESSEDEAATPMPSAGRRGGADAQRNTQGMHQVWHDKCMAPVRWIYPELSADERVPAMQLMITAVPPSRVDKHTCCLQ
jgi:hypothetical protein